MGSKYNFKMLGYWLRWTPGFSLELLKSHRDETGRFWTTVWSK